MKLGRITITKGALVLLAWLFYLDQQFLLPISAAACALHELGHYAAMHCIKKRVKALSITVSGVVMEPEGPMGYGQEALVALAGPGVSLFLAFFLANRKILPLFCGLNLLLGCLNFLPLNQLDGGRVLRCIVSLLFSVEAAERICAGLSCLLTGLLLAAGGQLLWKTGNVTLLCVALWQFSTIKMSKKYGFRSCHVAPKKVE